MRFALIGPTHPFRGGIAHYTTVLYQALSRDHEVRFFSLSRQYPRLLFPGSTQIDESSDAIQVPHEACLDSINPWTWLRTAFRIARYQPDLLVVSWWHPFFAPAFGTVSHLAWRLQGVPSCLLCHNVVPHESSWVDGLLLRYAFSGASAFITHSASDAEELARRRRGVPVRQNPHPTYDVFAGAPVDRDQARSRLGLSGKKVVLFFGFVRKYKGLDTLLEAMQAFEADPAVHLLVVGEFYDDPEVYRPGLENLRSRGQLTLIDRYVPNEEVPVYFAAADVVAVPYQTATQSGVVQIAYAFERPVVATTAGGLPEVVVDGATGYLVPPGEAGALGAAIRKIFAGGGSDRFAAAIRRENQRYSWDHMVRTIEDLAREVSGGA